MIITIFFKYQGKKSVDLIFFNFIIMKYND